MLQLYQRLALERLQAAVAGDTTAMVEYLHRSLCHTNIHFFANQVVRHRVLVPAVRYQIIVGDLGNGPDSRFKGHSRQRQHVLFLLFQIGAAPRTCHSLERAAIDFLQLFRYGLVHLADGEELPLTQRRNDPCLRKTHGCFRRALVLRLTDAGRNDRRAVVFGQFLVAAVQHGFISGVGRSGSFAVVRNQQPCHTAKILEGVDVTGQPVLCLHFFAGFRVGVAAARQHGDKQVRAALLSGCRVIHRKSISRPVHLDGVSWLVLDTHGGLRHPRPSPVLVPKLCAHVRRFPGLMALPAVFLPQKRHGHTRLRQLPVDVRVVRLHIPAPALILAGKQDILQLCVGDVVIQGPAQAKFIRCFIHLLRLLSGCHFAPLHFTLAASLAAQHEDLSVVRHFLDLLC